ncbi:DUF1868 domain-containing protein [Neoaquamicrobium sediminum]|uniref:DUF1868 domain-containing protein n=1 Tax=Neoaquamicrobium sediminum TaxID=1849104 RepID=UPI003BABF6AF
MAYETNENFARHFTAAGKDTPPRHLGTRYDRAGNFLNEPGNTFVSHIVDGSQSQKMLAEVREHLRDLPYADHFTFTPVSSLHKTLFQGVIEGRRGREYWPAALPANAAIPETTSWIDERLEGFSVKAPFRIKADMVTPLGVVVSGLTDADERVMREARDTLADRLGYRHPDHDDYTFHITLAYQLAWLPQEAEAVYLPALAAMKALLDTLPGGIELDVPAFCVFDDMEEFRPLREIG